MAGEWKQTTVGEVTDRVTKGTTPTTLGGRFVEHGISFVKVESLAEDGRILTDKLAHIDAATDALLPRSRLEQDDILFTIAGTIGRAALVPKWLLPANTNQAVAIVRPKRGIIDPRFLFYVLRDESRVKHAQTRVVQSVQANFSLGELSSLEMPLPPLAEQKAIAAVLGALDDKIELNRRMNATLEAMARALFQSWFVDFDPVRAKLDGRPPAALDPATATLFPDSFQDSEAGHIPKGWEVKTLSDLTSLITKGTTPTQDDMTGAPNSDTQINYVRVNSIDEDGSVLADKLTTIPESVHAGVLKRSILMANDVLYTIAGTIGRIALAEDWLLPANTNQAVAIIRPEPKIPSGFLMLTMRHEVFREELHNNIVHAVQANLSLGMLSKARVVVPPPSVLQQLFRPIEALLSEISANRAQSRTLATLRDTLLPKLLSGELSVRGASNA
jgi:type I restriction enzyme S subunit